MFTAIVSPNNPRVKRAAQLRESRTRRREGAFLVDGVREVGRAFRSGFEIVEVFWDAGKNVGAEDKISPEVALKRNRVEGDRLDELQQLLATIDSKGVPTIPLSSRAFEKIVFGDRNEGVVAVVKSKTSSLEELDAFLEKKSRKTGESPLLAVLEGVEKPGNVGAVLRSADGAGVDALLIAASEFDVFNPNAVRASLGAVFHTPIVVAPAQTLLTWTRERKIQRATALCDQAIPYVQLDYCLPTAIVLGSEANGLSDAWSTESREDVEMGLLKKIRLPMLGVADSLNVSNAAAILFYEARRVRSF